MKLAFELVLPNEEEKIKGVYQIIRTCGLRMYEDHGLVHWLSPYPIEAIRSNCQEREVFLVRDLTDNIYIHTFQLEFKPDSSQTKIDGQKSRLTAVISKFATLPEVSGRGVGVQSINYIEEYCRGKNVQKICLEVYDRSTHAIQFYEKRGFNIAGSRPTRHFTVYIMEKVI